MQKITLSVLLVLCLYSCKQGAEKDRIALLISEWNDKEILFPKQTLFSQGEDTNYEVRQDADYIIVSYMDSTGCTGCKLQLQRWKEVISEINSSVANPVECVFYFHPQSKKELSYLLLRNGFTYPVCFDENNEFYNLNKLPQDIAFQTFLLNKEHKVLAVGNPAHNLRVKELYQSIIQKSDIKGNKAIVSTKVSLDKSSISLGYFDWQEDQKVTFALNNIGNNLLIVEDVKTSCGCISIDYSKQPFRPGDSISIQAIYKADYPGHFKKTITVYCNADISPIRLTISGNAE